MEQESEFVSGPTQFSIEATGIRAIRVERLFGQYSYELKTHTEPGFAPRIMLLYGENGAGKTTILKILFYLLSHRDSAGHKSQLREFRFKKFLVELADGTEILASRNDDHERGYEVLVSRAGTEIARATYFRELMAGANEQISDREKFVLSERDNEQHRNYLKLLRSLKLNIIYLTDRRELLTTISDAADPEYRLILQDQRRRSAYLATRDVSKEERSAGLSAAVERITGWATKQAFQGSTQGEEDVNAVYADILRRISHAPRFTELASIDAEAIVNKLRRLQARSAEFAVLGLVKPLKAEPIIDTLKEAYPEAQQTMLGVLEPYVTGIEAKLDALESVKTQLSGFVRIMNSFYRHKEVQLDVNRGLIISSSNHDRLAPSMLSSGEGQLLFILASTILAKETASLFIIDEPEISLNVKWQRQLLRALLDLTTGSRIQFIMATHSIELITRYDDFVLDLDDIGGQRWLNDPSEK